MIQIKINALLRKATGALPSTPIDALLAETNTPYFVQTKNHTQTKIVVKSLIDSKHPLHQICRSGWTMSKKKKIRSALFNSIRYLASNNPNIPNAFTYDMDTTPWLFLKSTINISLEQMSKEQTLPSIYRKKFCEIISNGQFDCILYTDASTIDETTSYCVYRYDNKCDKIISQKLTTPNQSPFVGEVMALIDAFKIANERNDKTAICSDSLSAIRNILNNKNKTPIFHFLRSIIRYNFPRIHLIWCHVGIPGNEKADTVARETIKMPLEFMIPPFASSIFKIISNNIRREADACRNSSKSFLRQHKTTLGKVTYNESWNRLQSVQLCRIRLGHTLFNKVHLYKKEPPPICSFCQETLTLEHVLQRCTLTRQHFGNNVPPLQNLLDATTHPNKSLLFPLLNKHKLSEI